MTDFPAEITIYGTTWCPDCTRAVRFFKKNDVPFTWVDIARDDQARALVMEINQGQRSVPTILFPDGDILVEPSTKDLKRKFRKLP